MNTIKKIFRNSSVYPRYVKYTQMYRMYIKETYMWYIIKYLAGVCISSISTQLAQKNKEGFTDINTILIIYAKSHFNPDTDNLSQINSQSSAGNIARNLYNSFGGKKVIYVDHNEQKEIPDTVDLIIGMVCENFVWYAKKHPHAKKMLFLVNSHPLFRLKTLIQEGIRRNKKMSLREYVSPFVFLKCIRYTDQMFVIGNEFVKNTYKQQGIPEEKLILLNSGVNLDVLLPDHSKRPTNKLRVLYPSSHFALRKGLFRVMDIWKKVVHYAKEKNISVELVMLGQAEPLYEKEIQQFVSENQSVTNMGWVDSSTQHYRDILASSHVVLFPSLEEGQVGTVLEAMSTGAIPVMTRASGIHLSSEEGFVTAWGDSIKESIEHIVFLAQHQTDVVPKMSINVRKYIERNHRWDDFRNRVKKWALTGENSSLPRHAPQEMNILDIVISIFNQEKLIERQLQSIFKYTTTPFNLILVFDGCTDKTKPRALAYIAKYAPPNLKEFRHVDTPNIYELKANNTGYRMVTSEFFINLQDDVLIREKGWERRMTYPMRIRDDIMGITSRISENFGICNDTFHSYENQKGREFGTLARNTLAIRDRLNRGPIAWRNSQAKELGYYNEEYSPSDLDDADLALRGWETHEWKVGVFWINYLARLEWGKTRSKDTTMDAMKSLSRNQGRLGRDHRAYFDKGIKHDEEIIIEDSEIDYIKNPTLPIYFHYPIRFDRYHFRRYLESKIRGLHRITKIILEKPIKK